MGDLNHCYSIIKEYYGDKKAKRSGVPYINHIDEGLIILEDLRAREYTKAAYCMHPIFQDDDTLRANIDKYAYQISYKTLCMVMEYRNVANRGLNCCQVDNPAKIYLGPLNEVYQMLIADKVQNRKDFLTYHLGTHPGSIELDIYFKNWLRALGVLEAKYEYYCGLIDRHKILDTMVHENQQLGLYDNVNNPLIKNNEGDYAKK
jgi:hypothetical protein